MYHPIPSNLCNKKGSYDNHTTYTQKKKNLKLISKKLHKNIVIPWKYNSLQKEKSILSRLKYTLKKKKKIGNNTVQNKWSKTYIQEMNRYIAIPWKYK